jgi:hypothetical protein
VAEGDVRVIPYPLGRAINIVMPRRVTAGDRGDTAWAAAVSASLRVIDAFRRSGRAAF